MHYFDSFGLQGSQSTIESRRWSLAALAGAPTRRGTESSSGNLRASGPDASVEAGDEAREPHLVPAVHEVRVEPEAAGGDLRGPRRLRIEQHEHKRRNRNLMRGGTGAARGIRHVALVVGAVEASSVPAVREGDSELENAVPRAGRDRRRERTDARLATTPRGQLDCLRTHR